MMKDRTDPYLFISYAHKDSGKVIPVIRALKDRGVRLWFDEGIEAGAEWPKVIAENLKNAGAVLIFLSEHSVQSQNCIREIHYAVAEKKQMMTVRLDRADLPSDLGMQLSVVPEIPYEGGDKTAENILSRLDESYFGAPEEEKTGKKKKVKKINVWADISLILLLLLIGTGVVLTGYFLGWFNGAPVIQEETVENGTDEPISVTEINGALAMEITLRSVNSSSVFVAGNCMTSDASSITHDPEGFYVAGKKIERGPVKSIHWFKYEGITELAAVYENMETLQGIERLTGLTYLDVSGNPLTDVSAVSQLTELKTLTLLDVPETLDLSPLAESGSLKQVIISFALRDQAAPLVEAGIDVVIRR